MGVHPIATEGDDSCHGSDNREKRAENRVRASVRACSRLFPLPGRSNPHDIPCRPVFANPCPPLLRATVGDWTLPGLFPAGIFRDTRSTRNKRLGFFPPSLRILAAQPGQSAALQRRTLLIGTARNLKVHEASRVQAADSRLQSTLVDGVSWNCRELAIANSSYGGSQAILHAWWHSK